MNRTLLKTKECLHWMGQINDQVSDNFEGNMQIKMVGDNTLNYYDIEDNLCVLTFDDESILFNGQVFTFEEFINLLTGDDEYLIETMLGEINLDI